MFAIMDCLTWTGQRGGLTRVATEDLTKGGTDEDVQAW